MTRRINPPICPICAFRSWSPVGFLGIFSTVTARTSPDSGFFRRPLVTNYSPIANTRWVADKNRLPYTRVKQSQSRCETVCAASRSISLGLKKRDSVSRYDENRNVCPLRRFQSRRYWGTTDPASDGQAVGLQPAGEGGENGWYGYWSSVEQRRNRHFVGWASKTFSFI